MENILNFASDQVTTSMSRVDRFKKKKKQNLDQAKFR